MQNWLVKVWFEEHLIWRTSLVLIRPQYDVGDVATTSDCRRVFTEKDLLLRITLGLVAYKALDVNMTSATLPQRRIVVGCLL